MALFPNDRRVFVGGVTDMAAQSTFDIDQPAGFGLMRGFKFCFWDMDCAGAGVNVTLRFRAPGLISAGYSGKSVERLTGGGTGTIGTQTINVQPFGIEGTGASTARGFFKGFLMDEDTNEWAINGKFYDDQDDSVIEVWSDIDLVSPASGFRIQSQNVSNYAAGSLAYQFWT